MNLTGLCRSGAHCTRCRAPTADGAHFRAAHAALAGLPAELPCPRGLPIGATAQQTAQPTLADERLSACRAVACPHLTPDIRCRKHSRHDTPCAFAARRADPDERCPAEPPAWTEAEPTRK